MSILRFFESRIDPYPDQQITVKPNQLMRFLWACTQGVRGWLLLLMIFTAGVGILEGLLFAWMGDVVDWLSHYSPAELWQAKRHWLFGILLLLIVSPLWVFINSSIHFQTLQGNLPMRLRWQFHQKLLNQSMAFFQDEMSGRVSAKVMQTALAVRETIMSFTDMLVYVLVYFVTIGVVLAQFDWLLLLPFIVWIVLFVVSLVYFIPRLKNTALAQADARSLMTGRVTDTYANMSIVKLFSHSRRESAYAKAAMQDFMGTVHAQMRYVTGLEVANQSINALLIASTAGIGLWLWSTQAISVGAFAAATAMSLRVNGLAHWVMWMTASLFENIGTVQDGMQTFARPAQVVDQDGAPELEVTQGQIEFDNVSFNYQRISRHSDAVVSEQITTPPLLSDFSLNIAAGEKVGLVGRSGAGKSTLVNLLLRFYDIDTGAIRIDGQNIAQVTQDSLRSQIGMVTQDTALLHRSIRENIAYSRPDATQAQIEHVARQAHAMTFIQSLQDKDGNTGLDTQVGERGVKLSGGQRQRIAIARVMLKNAPILLLDEATSALDSEIEQAITDSLDVLMQGKTVIAIAHRLSTIAALDRLIVIDNGKIIEQGTHDDLIRHDGLYARLWRHQSGGFLGETDTP